MIKSKLISKAIFTDKSISTLNQLVDYTGIDSFAFMDQTHSNIVINASKAGIFKSDGLLTYKSNLGLLVSTADCMPILLKDNKKIGAVHSGWRGVKNKILEKTIQSFELNSLFISVGPHAQLCCYEVKNDVSKYFESYTEKRDGKTYLSLSESLKELSKKCGFRIEVSSICTICDSSYNSFRKNKTNNRQYGFIWK
mgnify:FL=1